MNKESSLCKKCNPPHKMFGEDHPRWKGGYLMPNGYMRVRIPKNHPRTKGKEPYILEHILVMEKSLDRYLHDGETIHHKNGIKDDNRIENLELWASNHPSGGRVSDLIDWAYELIERYEGLRLDRPAYY